MFHHNRKRRLLLMQGGGPSESETEVDDAAQHVGDAEDHESVEADVAVEAVEADAREGLAVLRDELPDPFGEAFRSSCRVPGEPPILLVDDGSNERSIPLTRPCLVVGRHTECDLPLVEKDVSYRHAYLQFVDGRMLCIDLGSRKGVRWPDGRRTIGWLDRNTPVHVGRHRLSWDLPEPGATEEAADEIPQLELRLQNAAKKSKRSTRCRLKERVVLIGRDEHCRVRLNDPSVSVFHASLVLTPNGTWIVDLVGRGGVHVNGVRVDCSPIRSGDVIAVGKYRFEVEEKSPLSAATTPVLGGFPMTSELALPSTVETEAPPRRAPSPTPSSALAPSAAAKQVESLTERFVNMQEAMFAESQSQLGMITQLISQMNANFENVIREEFARIHSVNAELRELYEELRISQDADRLPAEGPALDVRLGLVDGSTVERQTTTAEEAPVPAVDEDSDAAEEAVVPEPPPKPLVAAGLISDAEADNAQWRILQRINRLELERKSIWDRIGGFLGGNA